MRQFLDQHLDEIKLTDFYKPDDSEDLFWLKPDADKRKSLIEEGGIFGSIQ
jgi:hypothetical protein